ncbi:MAG: OmpH family outer membrane protein [Dysgonamonadaceae bacterium]|jgi:outer membrane protein|nr:OmpH family outer membrane protein [Dysgonamonadaceae bacterium]MDD3901320.1 OmpH family outer membrane protein [Dysgonamonadaceae bacterium]MDD4399726.1 OmpH family outer membrane protein [Dysgonamonadaceae bacterium]MEA5081253.1 OmpH family outer membrane protein [Dysgonamonadaceae bacterium]
MNNKTQFYIIGAVLAIAIIGLYVLYFTNGTNSKESSNSISFDKNDSTVVLPIAYVQLDSLLNNYNFSKDINEQLIRKEESARATLNQKERQFNAAAQTFQKNAQNNAFLTQERMQQEQQRLAQMEQDYQKAAADLSQDYALEQQRLNIQLNDTIKFYLKEYNKDKNYHMIFTNVVSDILYADKKYDITNSVIEYLNKQYGPLKSAFDEKKK